MTLKQYAAQYLDKRAVSLFRSTNERHNMRSESHMFVATQVITRESEMVSHLLHKLQTMAKHKPRYCNFSLSTENETIRNLRDQDLFNTLKISCNLFFLFSIEKVEASILKYAIPCIQTQFIFLYNGRISDGPILQVSTLELIINILIHHTSQSIHNADEQSTIYHS
jgi:hypothetical protein